VDDVFFHSCCCLVYIVCHSFSLGVNLWPHNQRPQLPRWTKKENMLWHSWILQTSCSQCFTVVWLFELRRLFPHIFTLYFVFIFLPFSQIAPASRLWPDQQVARFPSKNQLGLQMRHRTSLPFFPKKENVGRGFDFNFLLQASCPESNISKSFMDLYAFQIINAQIQQSKFNFKGHNFKIKLCIAIKLDGKALEVIFL